MHALYLFGASFLFVALKAAQQRNVAFDHVWLVPPFSFGMAFVEVYIIASVAQAGYSLSAAIGMGAGGSAGAIAAMLLHKRYVRKK